MALLSEDVMLWANGGGKAPGAALRPVYGAKAVAQFVIGAGRRFEDQPVRIERTEINAHPAFLFYVNGALTTVLILDILDGHIETVRFLANPDKLHALSRQAGS